MKVAFKKFNFQRKSEKWKKVLELEIKNLCHLSHPNIVKIYGAVLEHGSIGIVMEYLPYSLHQAMFTRGKQFSIAEKKVIIKHVCEGLKYLHSLEIVHCNLTSENVLLSAQKFAKIGNYGPKFVRSEIDSNIGGKVDSRYASPEILQVQPLNIGQLKKCDVYSLGILTYEVFEAKEPCESLPLELSNQSDLSPHAIVSYMLPHILDIAKKCWAVDFDKRPTAEKFLVKWNEV